MNGSNYDKERKAKCLSKTELFTSNHLNQLTFQTEDVRYVWCGRFFFSACKAPEWKWATDG